ncbi:MAG: FecR domain-containing protein [Pyrinomonadaceae bacterium]
MDKNFKRYYVDWWSVRRSSVYLLIALAVFLLVGCGVFWWLWSNNWSFGASGTESIPKDAATIISFEGTVKIIRVGTRSTELVTKTTYVQTGDTIQTMADGRAQVKMIDGSILSIRPNSTVVTRDSSSILGGTNVRVKLDDGQINVQTQNQGESSNNVVEIKESENKILAQTEASFNIDSATNRGEIRINRGGIESTSGNEKVSLKADEYLSVTNGKFGAKEALLRAPKLEEPSPSKQIVSGNSSEIRFVWNSRVQTRSQTFDLELAKSPFFIDGKMIADKEAIRTNSVTVSGLDSGTYFWRVRAKVESGQVSEWSEPAKFTILRRNGNGSIEATNWDVEDVGGNVYIVRGKTRPGATVKILDRSMFAGSDGAFRMQIVSKSPTVNVDIVDELGNRSQYSLSLKTGRAS